MPSLAIDEDKILSIQASKSGTGLSITSAGNGGRSTTTGATKHGAGVLLQPVRQTSNTASAIGFFLGKRIIHLQHRGRQPPFFLAGPLMLQADGLS